MNDYIEVKVRTTTLHPSQDYFGNKKMANLVIFLG
jgi:hypothetical protein